MKPSLLSKEFDAKNRYLITTTGGRKLIATPIFGKSEWGATGFTVDRFETILAQSVKDAEQIMDYYYSPSYAMLHGYCIDDWISYTERTDTGEQPLTSKWEDLVLVATKKRGEVRAFNKLLK